MMMKVRDKRFAQSYSVGPSGKMFNDNFGKRFATEDEAYASFLQRVEHAEAIAGRKLKREELIRGVAHAKPDQRGALADKARRQAELAGPSASAPQPTAAEIRLAHLQQKQFESLPQSERAVIEAQQQVDFERAEKARKEAHAQLLSSPQAVRTLANISKLLAMVIYDESVPQADIDELRHQKQMLLKFGDADAASANVKTIQDKLLNAARTQSAEARQHADKLSERERALLTGQDDFDVPPVVVTDVWGNKRATLKFGGQSVDVPFEQYEGRSTPELLKTHFNVDAASQGDSNV